MKLCHVVLLKVGNLSICLGVSMRQSSDVFEVEAFLTVPLIFPLVARQQPNDGGGNVFLPVRLPKSAFI